MNLTLLGQAIALLIFVFIVYRWIWPHIARALDNRRSLVQKGVQDALDAEVSLKNSEADSGKIIKDAHQKSEKIFNESQRQSLANASKILEDAKLEASRIIQVANENAKYKEKQLEGEFENEKVRLLYLLSTKILADSEIKPDMKWIESKIQGIHFDKEQSL